MIHHTANAALFVQEHVRALATCKRDGAAVLHARRQPVSPLIVMQIEIPISKDVCLSANAPTNYASGRRLA